MVSVDVKHHVYLLTNSWQGVKHAWLYSDIYTPGIKEKNIVISGFSREGTVISASAVPHCRTVLTDSLIRLAYKIIHHWKSQPLKSHR